MFRGAELAKSLNCPYGQVKASAKSFDFNLKTNSWNLTGDCAITIERNGKFLTRLEGDRATIIADKIEWQIYSNRTIPINDWSELLRKHPQISLIRLGWAFSMGSSGSSSTALYNRSSGIIKEYTVSGDAATGGTYINSILYSKLTDEMIYQATEDANKKEQAYGDLLFFSLFMLKDYGAATQERR